MFERLVYRSKATDEMGSLALFNLLAQARLRNAKLGITGHLIYDGEFFTQWIEGSSESLNELWASLLKDDRHCEVMLISRHEINERRYPEWTMAFSSYSSFNESNMPGFFVVDKSTVKDVAKALMA